MKTNNLNPILRKAGIAFQRMCRRICRNTKALWLRIILGIRHKDEEETLRAIIRMANEGIWLFCWLMVPVSFIGGFFNSRWFIGNLLWVVLAAMWRTIKGDEQLCR